MKIAEIMKRNPAMAELAPLIWIGRAEVPKASEQRLRWGI